LLDDSSGEPMITSALDDVLHRVVARAFWRASRLAGGDLALTPARCVASVM